MAYKILAQRDEKWQTRQGLEGPFYFANGRVLYYDAREGQYWDPTTDFYVENEEIDALHKILVDILAR